MFSCTVLNVPGLCCALLCGADWGGVAVVLLCDAGCFAGAALPTLCCAVLLTAFTLCWLFPAHAAGFGTWHCFSTALLIALLLLGFSFSHNVF
jgi:hypothetical protein